MKKILTLELDVTAVQDSGIIAIQLAQMENRSGIERVILVKRTSRDSFLCIPEPGNPNFLLSMSEKTVAS